MSICGTTVLARTCLRPGFRFAPPPLLWASAAAVNLYTLRWPLFWQGLWLSLNLRGNKIGAAGGRAIAAALAPTTLLQRLDLADTDQTVDSLIALRTAVEAGASLTHLILDRPLNPSHGEEAATHMSVLVARAPSLSVLSLQKVRGRLLSR